MFRQTGVELVPLTTEYVRWFSSLPTLKGDRDRDGFKGRRHVAWLKRLLDDGLFMGPCWSVAVLDGVRFRVDGGHSSRMLEEANGQFPTGLMASVRTFHCDSVVDLAELFDHFDNRNQIRTGKDKVTARKSVFPQYAEVSATAMERILAGIAWWLRSCGGHDHIDEDSKVRLMNDHDEFILFARPFLSRNWLHRADVIAAMYATWKKDQRAAGEFWTLVRDESAPDNTDPTRALASFLRDAKADWHNKTRWTSRAYYTKSIHAWNAWRQGRKLTVLKYHDVDSLPRPV